MTNPGQKRVFTDPDGPLVIDEPAPLIPHPVIDRFSGDYRWLSNFHPHPITIDQIFQPIQPDNFIYASTEFSYQACKSDDPEYRKLIRSCRKPSDAKRLGHDVKLRPGWDDLRVQVMEWLVRQKFQYPALRQLLLNTGDAQLIEGNPWGDTYFGVSNGIGQNYLGRILMKVRKELQDSEKRPNTGSVGWQIWNARG